MTHVLANVLSIALVLAGQQPPPPATFQLAAVQVAGAKRYTADDVTRLSGLAVGKPVTIADLRPAAERLASSGLFKKLQFRYVTAAKQLTVTFEFEEEDWTVPVIFDNFVWFTDVQIKAAVRQDVPSFDGTAPPAEGVPDLIVRSLQKLVESRGLPGRVMFSPQTDLASKSLQYLFMVKDPAPRICGMSVAGASADVQRELLDASKQLVGSEYSRFYVTSMSVGTLLDIYHRRGFWRAAFGPPGTVTDAPGCVGVNLVLQVSEGQSYAWDRANWSGHATLSAADLDTLLGMKPGDVADGSRITAGLRAVAKAYGTHGYITATTRLEPRLDDASKRAAFDITVTEGPQFRMGTLEVLGLPEPDGANLKKKWKLAAGEPYNTAYVDDFMRKEVFSLRRLTGKGGTLQTAMEPASRQVNVRVVFQ